MFLTSPSFMFLCVYFLVLLPADPLRPSPGLPAVRSTLTSLFECQPLCQCNCQWTAPPMHSPHRGQECAALVQRMDPLTPALATSLSLTLSFSFSDAQVVWAVLIHSIFVVSNCASAHSCSNTCSDGDCTHCRRLTKVRIMSHALRLGSSS